MMAYRLLMSDGHALLATDRAVVKAKDRALLEDALALLDHLRREADGRMTRTAEIEREARERGYAEGLAQGRAEFADTVARLAEQAEAHRRREEEEIAALALAAVRQIAGDLGDAAMMKGVALRAARAALPHGPVVIEVAPMIAAEVEARLAAVEGAGDITVRADPALGDRQCRVTGADSRIIADLDRQLDELAERWGTSHVD